jgi:hypothetical protein
VNSEAVEPRVGIFWRGKVIERSLVTFSELPGGFNLEVQQIKISMKRIALPPNLALQLTWQLDTPLAKRRARGAPSYHAAEL